MQNFQGNIDLKVASMNDVWKVSVINYYSLMHSKEDNDTNEISIYSFTIGSNVFKIHKSFHHE